MNVPVTRFAEGLARRAFTVAEVERMVEVGLLDPDERLEILGGEVVPMSPKGARHERLKIALARHWGKVSPAEFIVAQETGLTLDELTYVEPDFIIFRRGSDLEALRGPDVLLAVEVADSSLDYDLNRKPLIYAEHGVQELWVIDAARRLAHVHLGAGPGGYAWTAVREASERLEPQQAPRAFAFALDELAAL
jgi:Uma2 family endonuclease